MLKERKEKKHLWLTISIMNNMPIEIQLAGSANRYKVIEVHLLAALIDKEPCVES